MGARAVAAEAAKGEGEEGGAADSSWEEGALGEHGGLAKVLSPYPYPPTRSSISLRVPASAWKPTRIGLHRSAYVDRPTCTALLVLPPVYHPTRPIVSYAADSTDAGHGGSPQGVDGSVIPAALQVT